jgi:small subunit ribosomal protein S4
MKYTGPDCRLCRREGTKLFLKGEKCFSSKCTFIKRQTPPGIHGLGRKKPTPYSIQLREKQKAKRVYGLTEKQFHMYYLKADKMAGVTGENMLALLERRLDNVVYRMGIGASRAQARQLVNHGHITVDGQTVNIPSFLVKAGAVIAIKATKRDLPFAQELRSTKIVTNVKWLKFNPELLEGEVLALPTRQDIDMDIKEQMIVELYSK